MRASAPRSTFWLAIGLASCLAATACTTGDSDDDGSLEVSSDTAGDPKRIDLGFNGGADGAGVKQFEAYPAYFNGHEIQVGSRVCHTYLAWNVATEAPAMGNVKSVAGHRAAFEYWLANAQTDGHCAEVLVSFQDYAVDSDGKALPGAVCPRGGKPPCEAPTEGQYKAAFEKFLAQPWAAETGYTGAWSFTPWNEPNNPYGGGNGLGTVIPPALDAHFYLMMAARCANAGCVVAAGDFASNGDWWDDYELNCAADNVSNMTVTHSDGSVWCRSPSRFNPGNRLPASYLDIYKDTIALDWKNYPGVAERPAVFAFHGWHDVNQYLDHGEGCENYGNCLTQRVLISMGATWANVKIWDTEVGASQGENIDDDTQACVAAFALKVHSLSSRIERVMYTRLYNKGTSEGGSLLDGETPATATQRAAAQVLAVRATKYTRKDGKSCP